MTDFDLFDEILHHYETTKEESCKEKEEECSHVTLITENSIISCAKCGMEIIKNENTWKSHTYTENKTFMEPSRVQARKNDDKNIYRDVENMGFSERIINTANNIYQQVTKGQVKKGNSRKAIVFACIFQAYKLSGYPQSHEKLIQIFNLNRKTVLYGLKQVALNIPKDSEIHTMYITPVHLVDDIMNKFQATQAQKLEVIEIYEKIKNKDTKLNRARPQSIAAGLAYYWIKTTSKNISLKEFMKKAELSELTINRMTSLIAEIVDGKKSCDNDI
jgi:transcription initiation factor TFIIIB Brf1 subunit/transcription initiation factor TFIIB